MHMVLVGTRNWQPNWLRTGGEQQSIIAEPFAVSLNDFRPFTSRLRTSALSCN